VTLVEPSNDAIASGALLGNLTVLGGHFLSWEEGVKGDNAQQ
jgi:hypothetical protein